MAERPDMEPDEVLGLIGRIYDTVLDPSLWPAILEEICAFVEGGAAAIFWQDAFDRGAIVFHSYGEDPHYTRLYLGTYAAMNPLFPAMSFIEPGIVVGGGDLIPHEEFRQTRFFKEWVAPQGFIDAAAVNLQRYATSTACFSIRRLTSQGVIDAEAVRRIELLAPHIRRAVLIGRQIATTDALSEDMRGILDAAASAVFLVDEASRLTFANEAGQALLEAGEIVSVRDGLLHLREAEAHRRLREMVMGGAIPANGSRRTVSLPLTEDAPRWLADILPLSSGARLRFAREHCASAAVFVRRAEIPVVSGIEVLARLHKLTASEIRVLQAVTGGGSVGEIAESLGLSLGTVKTQLNSLFTKTGARGRIDLVREVAAHGGPLR